MAYQVAEHHRGTFRTRARKVREAANENSLQRCWRCGELGRGSEDPWQAGHLVDGDYGSPLLAEHRSCNASAGAKLGASRWLRTSRKW